jgi:hypothetical protein
MDWTQVLVILGTNMGLFLWNRSESRTDIRHMDSKLESTRELVRAIHDEMKDFHNRLCKIEENRR